ncbi:MAG: DUF2779 domain-containing protein [Bacteroidetes bacterium]|nr:DUF2779 domain-containing protein [Bacteroidota bacterium]
MSSPFLTKSRFKIALECADKLYFARHDSDFPSEKTDDQFLLALAEGGFQVGELAKLLWLGGIEILTRNHADSVSETEKLLQQDSVTIYEAAFQSGNLFIRADVVVKKGNQLFLYEVKAKSWSAETEFWAKRKESITSTWAPYLYDVAFQDLVIRKAHPEFIVHPHLILADKTIRTTSNRLNQKFKIRKLDGQVKIDINAKIPLGEPLLRAIDVSREVQFIQNSDIEINEVPYSFSDAIDIFANHYEEGIQLNLPVGKRCGACEYRATEEQKLAGKKDGFEFCWTRKTMLKEKDLTKPMVFELWNYRKKEDRILEGRFFLSDLGLDDLGTGKTADRQWLQVQKRTSAFKSPWLNLEFIRQEMAALNFPLHFIDFETSIVAIPFFSGQHPYETVAFQYSHHILEANGTVRHAGQWLSDKPGDYPNFEFIRALKKELGQDDGTIFRYANHENSVLNQIAVSLENSTEPDKTELIAFIRSITQQKEGKGYLAGNRNMVDLLQWVLSGFYSPVMKGSNSIKAVLPAVLYESSFLREKYSKPIYGTKEIESLNFTGQVWIRENQDGTVDSPYHFLPPIFEQQVELENSETEEGSVLSDGGAAMTAWAKLQFEEISGEERKKIREALLRYCELDTLAMVMIWEYFADVVKKGK